MMKFRGQENGRKEFHYHEREGGIVCKYLAAKVESTRGISSELPNRLVVEPG